MARRGAFIVLEGLDRSGKSTQVERLVAALQARGHQAKAVRFPDRTTAIGSTIDAYLSRRAELDDRAIHLLFAANRWERVAGLLADLQAGVCIVADRYAFSGAAFSVAKVRLSS
jgi:dTMP kinase